MTEPPINQTPPQIAIERLDKNWAEFVAMVGRSQSELRAGRCEPAALWAQIAATFAWFNHTGVFASRELEEVLQTIAQTSMASGSSRFEGRHLDRPRHVLHVATQLYPTGGHTQMIAKWLARDTDAQHRIYITAQRGRPVPAKISRTAHSQTDVVALDHLHDTLIHRARALRDAAAWADCVVLHIHPNDVVPVLAFAGGDGPPVVYVNHADHVFWIGVLSSTVIMNLRRSGARLTVERRGVDPARSTVVVRPLSLSSRIRKGARQSARWALTPIESCW